MYLYRFAMQKLPFGLTPDTQLFCPLPTHVEALNVLSFAINSGEALIKVVGEVGTGKTMLCRLLMNRLEGKKKIAYIPNPKLSARELKFSLARELGLKLSNDFRNEQLTHRIQTRLLNLNKQYGSVILIIDEAQQLDKEGLETLRLFTNIETEHQKLLQIVLFGQPELDDTLNLPEMRQVKQRIVFSYRIKTLGVGCIKKYVTSRLHSATKNKVGFSPTANLTLAMYSRGIPRLVNILCHKALLLAFGQGKQAITTLNLIRAAKDTESISTKLQDHVKLVSLILALTVSGSAMAVWSLI